MPSLTPVTAASNTPVFVQPTVEQVTQPPTPIPPSPTATFRPPPTQVMAQPVTSVAILPSATSASPTSAPTQFIRPTFTATFTPSPTNTLFAPPVTATYTPFAPPVTATYTPFAPPGTATYTPFAPPGTATFTPIPFNPPQPTATYTPYIPPPTEIPPLAERPTETLPPPEGQGGPVAVAQFATLSPNQMTATSIVAGATMTAAALQGTFVPIYPTPIPGQVIIVGPTATYYYPGWTPTPMGQCNTHLVAPDETLTRIALIYNVTAAQIAQANNIVNPNLIMAGSTLIIPCPVPASPTPYAPEGQGGVADGVGTPYPTTGPFVYTVAAGDNLYRISLRFNVSMSELMAVNGMTPATINLIYVGQQLYIPAGGVAPTPTPYGWYPTPTPYGWYPSPTPYGWYPSPTPYGWYPTPTTMPVG
jgi:LysM repeat protein